MEYLKDYITISCYDELINILSLDIQSSLTKENDNVKKVLNYLKKLGVTYFDDLVKMRYDLLFSNVDELKNSLDKLDQNFVLFIIQNDVGNLINLGI